MNKLKAKSQIVLVLCHLMGRRRSFDVKAWRIKMKEKIPNPPFIDMGSMIDGRMYKYQNKFYHIVWRDGDTYSRKWRGLKGEDYYNWFWGDPFPPTGIYFSNYLPTFTKSDNTWHLPKEFCKFLRAERDRILRGAK